MKKFIRKQYELTHMKHLNLTTFITEVLESKVPVVIDFWASWCNPCRMMAPEFEELDKELGDKIKFCKVNTEENPEISQQYTIQSIPTMLIFKDGKIIGRFVGFAPKEQLKQIILNALKESE